MLGWHHRLSGYEFEHPMVSGSLGNCDNFLPRHLCLQSTPTCDVSFIFLKNSAYHVLLCLNIFNVSL